MKKAYLIYTNGNGTDAYPLEDEDEDQDKYRQLLEELDDDYFEVTATCVVVNDSVVIQCWEVFLPEKED